MTRESILVAVAAALISMLLHGLGLFFTAGEGQPPSTRDVTSGLTDAGDAFEDFAENMTEPAEPEQASAPDPPDVTSPDQVIEETPTSRAKVASDTPQDVTAPDTGTVDVIEPDAAAPSGDDASASDTVERSGGEDASVADVAVSQPAEPETAIFAPDGAPDENPRPAEARAAAAAPPSSAETIEPVTPTSEPSPGPTLIEEPDVQQPVPPQITVAPEAEAPEVLKAGESEDASGSAVTTSLRPPKERPSAVAPGVPDGEQHKRDETQSVAGTMESPLTTYKRTGIDPFAAAGGGARSRTTGFSGSRNPGNANTTNYAGRVLVHLNRSPPVYPSAQGTARVSFEINPDGTVAWVSTRGSASSRNIERAASAQVRGAAPFPRPPQGTSRRLVFVYRSR